MNAYMNDVGENPMLPPSAYRAVADGIANYTAGASGEEEEQQGANGTLTGVVGTPEGVQTT